MKPFTLRWWMEVRDLLIEEVLCIMGKHRMSEFSGTAKTPEQLRIDELIEVIDWVKKRTINKYGE